MARKFASVNVDIWGDPDFRLLPPGPQHLYLQLWTSPELSNCGVHDWRPARLTGLSSGYTAEHIQTLADCLAARHFLLMDDDTEELLVRSWLRFDGILKEPKKAVAAVAAYAATGSQIIRAALVHELTKIREQHPEYSCWRDGRMLSVLDHPSASAKDLPTPKDPFKGIGNPSGLAMGLPIGKANPKASGLPTGLHTATPAPTPAPSTSTPKDSPATDAAEDRFEEFWALYPRREGKGHAVKAWKRATKTTAAEVILEAIADHASHWAKAKTERQFIPLPATWLNGERWTDEHEDINAEPDVDPWAQFKTVEQLKAERGF